MKKLAFLFVAAAAMSMVSCGGNATQEGETEDTLNCEVVGCTHSDCEDPCDSCAALNTPIDTLTHVIPAGE